MKNLFIITVLLTLTSVSLTAQRFAYVDTDYILSKIPAYNQAQQELDAIAEGWRNEIDKIYAEIDKMYKKFQAEQYLLDETTKKLREEEIINKEAELKDFQKQKFGYEGELFQKRQELVKPIQDRVYNAIKELAETRNYDFILDKASSGSNMLYANPRYDKSDEIIKQLEN
jgi:outer membrane protein